MPDMKVSFPGGKKVNVEFSGFTVLTDQSAKNGGEGSAPEPFSYFLASLAACAGVYVLGFCQNRSIPTEGISLTQRVEWDDSRERPLKKISLEISLPESFPDKYRLAVVNSAGRCTVKQVLNHPPEFDIHTIVKGS
jgi:putative redox protein